MLYDDLQSQYGQFNHSKLNIPPQNVHIVFWECVNPLSPAPPPNDMKKVVAPLNDHHIAKRSDSTSPLCLTVNQKRNHDLGPSLSNVVAIPLNKPKPMTKLSSVDPKTGTTAGPPASLQSSVYYDTKSAKRAKLVKSVSAPQSTRTGLTSGHNVLPYTEIMNLNIGSTTLSMCSSSTNSAVRAAASANKSPSKSYLDLVKPLLDRNKQKKNFSGYVPLSKRTDDAPTMAQTKACRKKRVMFTKDTRSRSSTPVRSPKTLASQVQCDRTSDLIIEESIKPSTKPKLKQVAHITDRTSPAKPDSLSLTLGELDDCNMPELDNLLDLFSM